MLPTVSLVGIVLLVAALPAQANEGKELRISRAVVRASTELASVENRLGDAVLPPASGEEKRLYRKITTLSRDRVTA